MVKDLVILIVIVFAIFVGFRYYERQKHEKYKAKGDIIERGEDFFKQMHVYTTKIKSLEDIFNAINRSKLAEYKIDSVLETDMQRAVFGKGDLAKNSTQWMAMLAEDRKAGSNDELYEYAFAVTNFNISHGKIDSGDYDDVNVLLTEIERTLFRMDAETKVERTHNEYK